jgi:hypothetical protein
MVVEEFFFSYFYSMNIFETESNTVLLKVI